MKETFYKYNTPVKICLLADIHDRPFVEIISSLKRQKPDVIAVAGDILDHVQLNNGVPVVSQSKHSLNFLKACSECAKTFFSLGNHEWMLAGQDKEIISKTGVTVLDNDFTRYKELCLGGLSSSGASAYQQFCKGKSESYPTWHYHNAPQHYEPNTDWLNDFEKQDGYKLLLCHHPEYWEKYLSEKKIDLVLSGHAHGGQIRLFGRGLFAPGQGIFPKYTSGIHGNLIISRGLANTAGMIPRLFNRREIVYICPNK